MRAATRLAFAGVLLLLLDLRIERFDVLNDVVGAVLVVLAVGRLPSAGTRVADERRLRAWWVALLATTLLQEALLLLQAPEHAGTGFRGTTDSLAGAIVETAWAFVALFAYLALVDRYRALTAADPDLRRTWSTSRRLVTVLLVPATAVLVVLGVVDVVRRIGGGASTGFHLQLEGAAALVLAPIVLLLLAPVAHVALFLWRTSRDAPVTSPGTVLGPRP
jgi:hypothetical protein